MSRAAAYGLEGPGVSPGSTPSGSGALFTHTHTHTHTYIHAHVDVTADAVPGTLALMHGARWRHASRRVGGEGPRCPKGPAEPLGWPALYAHTCTCPSMGP